MIQAISQHLPPRGAVVRQLRRHLPPCPAKQVRIAEAGLDADEVLEHICVLAPGSHGEFA